MMTPTYERNQQRRLDRLRRQRQKLSDLVNDCFDGGPTRWEVAKIEDECRKFAEALARALVIDGERGSRVEEVK